MRKFLRWFIRIIAVLLLVLATAIVFRNPLLKAVTRYNLEQSTGFDTTIGGFDLDISASRLRITNLRIINSGAFGGAVFIAIPEMYCQLDGPEAARGKLHFNEVRFNLAEANVVRNSNGVTNLEALKDSVEKHSRRKRPPHTNTFEFGGIEKLIVSLGKVSFTDLRHPESNRQFELGLNNETVRNLQTEEDVQNWLMAMMIRLTIQQSLSNPDQRSTSKFWELLFR